MRIKEIYKEGVLKSFEKLDLPEKSESESKGGKGD